MIAFSPVGVNLFGFIMLSSILKYCYPICLFYAHWYNWHWMVKNLSHKNEVRSYSVDVSAVGQGEVSEAHDLSQQLWSCVKSPARTYLKNKQLVIHWSSHTIVCMTALAYWSQMCWALRCRHQYVTVKHHTMQCLLRITSQ